MKLRCFLGAWCLIVAGCVSVGAAATPEEILAQMSTQDKIAQLFVPAYRTVKGGTTSDVTVLCDEVSELVSTYPFSGIILYGENLANNDTATLLIHQLQKANQRDQARPQLLIMTDQEGGVVARLGHSTSGFSEMALGAAGNPAYTQTIAKLIGEEIKALGINSNLAPVADIPTDPHTAPLGVRVFSDSADITTTHVTAFLTGLRAAGVLNCLKYFPGIGSAIANADDVDAFSVVHKTRAQMDACELKPFRQALAAGLVDMVMMGHVSYPQLETRTFVGSEGKTYVLPASLAPTIVTGLLREELGFDGLVLSDTILGTPMVKHLSLAALIELMLEAGTDIVPYAVELNQPSSVTAFQAALETLTVQVDADATLRAKLDATVKRILTFKKKHDLLTPYVDTDAQALTRSQKALQTVSNQDNHETQWSVALKAVTLVQHEGEVLPLQPDTKVAVLYYYASQSKSVQYGLDRLVATGQLTKGQAEAVKILDVHADNLLAELEGIETVVLLSSVYYESELDPQSPSPYSDEIIIVLPLLEKLSAQGVTVILASCHLPYELGLYRERASVLLAGYLANGISTAITTLENQPKFGAMVPAIIYKLYDRLSDFSGHLPVNIPDVVNSAYQSEHVVWPCGWGLTLMAPDEEIPDDGKSPSDGDEQSPSDRVPPDQELPHTHNPRSGGCNVLGSAWCWLLATSVAMYLGKKR